MSPLPVRRPSRLCQSSTRPSWSTGASLCTHAPLGPGESLSRHGSSIEVWNSAGGFGSGWVSTCTRPAPRFSAATNSLACMPWSASIALPAPTRSSRILAARMVRWSVAREVATPGALDAVSLTFARAAPAAKTPAGLSVIQGSTEKSRTRGGSTCALGASSSGRVEHAVSSPSRVHGTSTAPTEKTSRVCVLRRVSTGRGVGQAIDDCCWVPASSTRCWGWWSTTSLAWALARALTRTSPVPLEVSRRLSKLKRSRSRSCGRVTVTGGIPSRKPGFTPIWPNST